MSRWMDHQQYASRINFLLGQAEAVTGLYGAHPRIEIPPPPTIVQGSRMTFNNVRVDRSVVGVINTGDVRSIGAVLTDVQNAGNQGLASALKNFTQAVIDGNELAQESKNGILSQLSFLAEQISSQRKVSSSVTRSVLTGIASTVNFSASMVALWGVLHPHIAAALG